MKKLLIILCFISFSILLGCDGIIPASPGVIREFRIIQIDIMNNMVINYYREPPGIIVAVANDFKFNFQIEPRYDDDLRMEILAKSMTMGYIDSANFNTFILDWDVLFDKDIPLNNAYVILSVTPAWGTYTCQTQNIKVYLRDLLDDPDQDWNIPINLPNSFYNDPYFRGIRKGTLGANIKIQGRR
jgi:hypothetical protein